MKQQTVILNKEKLIKKAVAILTQELGPVETYRFISLAEATRVESVKRHRQWQAQLDKKDFFNKVFGK